MGYCDPGGESIDNNKRDAKGESPGVDGFPIEFFTTCWDKVKADVLDAILHFFSTNELGNCVNCIAVTLVPKTKTPTYVKDYKPIAWCTTVYKIITKVLTSRLKKFYLWTGQAGVSKNALVAGARFKPDAGVGQTARKCICQNFNGYWTSWQKVPEIDRERMFQEFNTAEIIPSCPGDAIRAAKGLRPLDDISTDEDAEDEDEYDEDEF
ncbi:uncharacterized protein LOC124885824 [Capsicum annuum]|uniref:uncharacterized protein LOC124885824 n=1 Tax=Capsicum annuum TaxID=4072 RepID=UPI001FB13C69|nr:uncharacterized protein LOC124885824 [Capsicum annuum]